MSEEGITDDLELVERIVTNDSDAIIYLLVDCCGSRLNYLVNVKYRSLRWQFDDLVSELYLLLGKDDWRALKMFRGSTREGRNCSLVNYVVLIASRMMTKRMLSGMRDQTTLDFDGMARVPSPDADKLRTVSELMQLIQMMEPSSERDILVLVKIHGFDYQEVAEKLGITVDNAYARCSRAIKHLRKLMNEEGVHHA